MTRTCQIVISFILFSILFPSLCRSAETITGQYCYTCRDGETMQESREIVRTLSIRNGIESSRFFIESSAKVKNVSLFNDLVQIISSGYLKNLKVLEHTEDGRTVCEKISWTVIPEKIEKVMKQVIESRMREVERMGLDNNGYIKIFSVSEEQFGDFDVMEKTLDYINVGLKALRKFRSDDEHGTVFITFYDLEGHEIYTDKEKECFYKPVFPKAALDAGGMGVSYEVEDIYPGEIRYCSLRRSYDVYKVWLYGGQFKNHSEASEPGTAKPAKKRKSNGK